MQAYGKLSSSPELCLLILLSPGDPAWPHSILRLLGIAVRKWGSGVVVELNEYTWGRTHLCPLILKMRKLGPGRERTLPRSHRWGRAEC